MRISIIGTLLGAGFACVIPTSAAPRIRVMVLDGEQAGAYHAWQETKPYLKRMLDDAGLFQVDVVTAPPRGGDSARSCPIGAGTRWLSQTTMLPTNAGPAV